MNEKDWDGNYKSVYVTLGASSHTKEEREKNDYYATDPSAIDFLINSGIDICKDVWEPACGEGHLSKRLKDYGYNVWSTDLIDRGYCDDVVDFLKYDKKWHGDIITNPPYKYAQEFVTKALDLVDYNNRIFMFLKLQFLEGKSRRKLFDTKQLETLLVSSSRIICAKNGDFDNVSSSAVAYGWFVFKKFYGKDPVIKWIN